jgi:hypothetical protein
MINAKIDPVIKLSPKTIFANATVEFSAFSKNMPTPIIIVL